MWKSSLPLVAFLAIVIIAMVAAHYLRAAYLPDCPSTTYLPQACTK